MASDGTDDGRKAAEMPTLRDCAVSGGDVSSSRLIPSVTGAD